MLTNICNVLRIIVILYYLGVTFFVMRLHWHNVQCKKQSVGDELQCLLFDMLSICWALGIRLFLVFFLETVITGAVRIWEAEQLDYVKEVRCGKAMARVLLFGGMAGLECIFWSYVIKKYALYQFKWLLRAYAKLCREFGTAAFFGVIYFTATHLV